MHSAQEAIPSSAGKYRILAELGQGGMADVFLAVASGRGGFNKLVVLKMLRKNLATSDEFVSLFMQEARLAARLNHPNVVQTYEVDVIGGRHAIIMEYMDGHAFSQIAEKVSPDRDLYLRMGLRVMIETLGGLHYAHELADYNGSPLNLVHRDVSPHNVFITYDGTVKVLDFGIAKVANSGNQTQSGVMKGKIRYMAPEQMVSGELDRRADVFAVGVMLWEVITGERMWKGEADVAVMHHVIKGSIPPPAKARTDLPERLTAICMKALAIAREQRYATAAEFQSDIEEYVASNGLGITPRQLGKVVSERFEQQRANLKAIVDAQLAKVAEASAIASGTDLLRSGEVPFIGQVESTGSGDVAGPSPSASGPNRNFTLSSAGNAPARAVGSKGRPLWVIAAVAGAALLGVVAFAAGRVRDNPPEAAAAAQPQPAAPPVVDPPPLVEAHSMPTPPPSASAAEPTSPLTPVAATPPAKKRSGATTSPRPAATTPTPTHADKAARCNPPFFIDDQGFKQPKPECL